MEIGQKVKIISDSTCDLSQELTAKYDIDILPLHILLGENEFRDGKDITPERIFAWADANKATPKTSAPSLEDAKVLLQPYVEVGREVICFSISGSMSTSGNVMRLADAIKKTQKRTNALSNVMIPKFTSTVKFISDALDEKEREDFSRLKVIKRQKGN